MKKFQIKTTSIHFQQFPLFNRKSTSRSLTERWSISSHFTLTRNPLSRTIGRTRLWHKVLILRSLRASIHFQFNNLLLPLILFQHLIVVRKVTDENVSVEAAAEKCWTEEANAVKEEEKSNCEVLEGKWEEVVRLALKIEENFSGI